MTPRSFFAILIKVIGLYLTLESVVVIPQFFSMLNTFRLNLDTDTSSLILPLVFAILTVVFFFCFLYFCFFKTEWIIDKLHLDKGFAEEKFEFNIHRSTVLRIAIIVIGGLLLLDSLPSLFNQVYSFIGQKNISGITGTKPKTGWLIFYFTKIAVGYFMLTSTRLIVNFIERQRKK